MATPAGHSHKNGLPRRTPSNFGDKAIRAAVQLPTKEKYYTLKVNDCYKLQQASFNSARVSMKSNTL